MTDPIRILEIEFIHIIDIENLHTTDTETILTNGIETFQTIEIPDINIIDHAIIQTKDQNIIIIKIDHAIIHKTEVQAITDNETTVNLHPGTTQVIIIHNKIIGVKHLNIKDKKIKYNQLKKLNQTPSPGFDNNESTKLQLNNINCEFTDSESDTENTISINLDKC